MNDHRWSFQIPLMWKLLAFLIFPIQISIEQKWKSASTRAGYFGTIRDFLQRAPIGTSFDVSWLLVAQAIPENKLFL